MDQISWSLIAPIIIIQVILMIIALIDLFRTAHTNGDKRIWLLIIIFGTIPGPIIYFIFGRRQHH